MFVLPALILPPVFGLAIYRMYQIPRRLWSGELVLPGKQHAALSAATIAAYLALLGYTIWLGTALVQAFFVTENRMAAYLSLAFYITVYPLVYVGAAWVFYHGLKPRTVPGN